jgi:penicillin amidase
MKETVAISPILLSQMRFTADLIARYVRQAAGSWEGHKPMMRIVKGLIKLILLLVPLAVMALGAGMLWVSRSQAPSDGAMRIAGLGGEVTITRDVNGVPHIKAATRGDVAAGLGFAHAQDRLWQMEVSRMAGQGRLSELFGDATISTDIWLRTMAISEAAELLRLPSWTRTRW